MNPQNTQDFFAGRQQAVHERPIQVLIVEDDLGFRTLWEAVIFQSFPQARLDWTTSEEQAEAMVLERYRTHQPYDLVIADVFLAGQRTGIDLWTRFGEAANQFIFVSGITRQKFDNLMASDVGSPIFLQKPLRAKDCSTAVKAATY